MPTLANNDHEFWPSIWHKVGALDRRPVVRKLRLEKLENRQLMAVDVLLAADEVVTSDVRYMSDAVELAPSLITIDPTPSDLATLPKLSLPIAPWMQINPNIGTVGESDYLQQQLIQENAWLRHAADLKMIEAIDPQPDFLPPTDFPFPGWSGESPLNATARATLRIGDTLYFQTIRPDGTGDIAAYDGHVLSYAGFHTALTSSVGTDGEMHYDLAGLPQHFTEFQGQLYFTANTRGMGNELCSFDGHTLYVFDLTPGEASSPIKPLEPQGSTCIPESWSLTYSPSPLTIVQDTMYFRLGSGADEQLWRFDGEGFSTTSLPAGLATAYWNTQSLADGSMLISVVSNGWPYTVESAFVLSGNGLQQLGGDGWQVKSTAVVDGQLYVVADSTNFGRELFHWNGSALDVLDSAPGADSTLGLPTGYVPFGAVYNDIRGHLIVNLQVAPTDVELDSYPTSYVGSYLDIDGQTIVRVDYIATRDLATYTTDMRELARTDFGNIGFQAVENSVIDRPFTAVVVEDHQFTAESRELSYTPPATIAEPGDGSEGGIRYNPYYPWRYLVPLLPVASPPENGIDTSLALLALNQQALAQLAQFRTVTTPVELAANDAALATFAATPNAADISSVTSETRHGGDLIDDAFNNLDDEEANPEATVDQTVSE